MPAAMTRNTGRGPSRSSRGPAASRPSGPASIAIVSSAVITFGRSASGGAIFNYFPNKQALFVALTAASSDRFVEIWLDRGFRALLEEIAHADPDWIAVQIEAARRIRTDPLFREQVELLVERNRERRGERYERLRRQGSVREDLPIETVVAFLSLVANGLAFDRIGGWPLPDLDGLMELVESGVAPR